MVDDKGPAAAEASDGGHSVLHVSTDQVNVVYLHGAEMLPCYYYTLETHVQCGQNLI